MPGDELFKRYLEIGASVLGMSRERAETIVKDLVASGEVARSQATKAADWLVERGRSGTEELAELVRREVRQQVASLGLATKADIERLEAQLAEARSSAANAATPTTAASSAAPGTAPRAVRTVKKKAAVGDAAVADPVAPAPVEKKPAAKRTVAKKPAPGTTGGVTSTVTGSASPTGGGAGGAGITRSGSVRRRPGASGAGGPGAAPPAGGAVPPKG